MFDFTLLIIPTLVLVGIFFIGIFWYLIKLHNDKSNNIENLKNELLQQTIQFQQNSSLNQKQLHDEWKNNVQVLQSMLQSQQHNQNETILKTFHQLTNSVDSKLQNIHNTVNKTLHEGFDSTQTTFHNVIKQLSSINEAQKKLEDLSSNIISLQDILADKRSRGAFGEIQLESLISNCLPVKNYQIQAKLSNQTKVDCLVFLPEPIGKLPIDAKFPLENYQKMTNFDLPDIVRKGAEKQFKDDVKKHIEDISGKYIIPGETSTGAIMFIPAEAIFAEIHRSHPEVINLSYKKNVWLASPTTMMAILTVMQSTIRNIDMQNEFKKIQENLVKLSSEFIKFDSSIDAMHKNLEKTVLEVGKVQSRAKKIIKRFNEIESLTIED